MAGYYKTANEIAPKLKTQFAKQALKEMDKMGARWVVIEGKSNKVYLAPTIEISDGAALFGSAHGWGENYDDIIKAYYKDIVERASQPGKKVVVDAYQPTRKEYQYDPDTKGFKRI